MKKIFSFAFVLLVLSFACFVFAEAGDGESGRDSGDVAVSSGQGGDGQAVAVSMDTQNKGNDTELQNRVQERVNVLETSDGKQMRIQETANNRVELKVGDSSAQTGMRVDSKTVNGKTVLSTSLSNGRNAEIKIMPDTAGEMALERLRLKVCPEETCQMELKEVGSGEGAKLAYEVKAQRTSKVLGLFRKNMQVQAQIDAENGEMIGVDKPWWAFLASEPEE